MSTIKTIQPLPRVVVVNAHVAEAFATAAILVRQGYYFSPDANPEIFTNGYANLVLTLGSPDDASIKAAEVARAEAREIEAAEFERAVQAAAKVMIETAAREEKQKQLAAVRAAQEKEIAKLTAELSK